MAPAKPALEHRVAYDCTRATPLGGWGVARGARERLAPYRRAISARTRRSRPAVPSASSTRALAAPV